MQVLYDSENFVVVHTAIGDPAQAAEAFLNGVPFNAPLVSHGFEIVDKRKSCEVFLYGFTAEAFQRQINRWQLDTPDQSDVEACLEGYTQLGQLPMVLQ